MTIPEYPSQGDASPPATAGDGSDYPAQAGFYPEDALGSAGMFYTASPAGGGSAGSVQSAFDPTRYAPTPSASPFGAAVPFQGDGTLSPAAGFGDPQAGSHFPQSGAPSRDPFWNPSAPPVSPSPFDYQRASRYVEVEAPAPRAPQLDEARHGIGPLAAYGRAFRKFATFSGRASRGEYWWFVLTNMLISGVLWAWFAVAGGAAVMSGAQWSGQAAGPSMFDMMRGSMAAELGAARFVVIILYAWALICFVPNLSLTCRRLHDSGHSAVWIVFSALVPFLGVVLLVFLLQRSR
jgi:uncharacterized membrane protein YhaH (DUF805 family)